MQVDFSEERKHPHTQPLKPNNNNPSKQFLKTLIILLKGGITLSY